MSNTITFTGSTLNKSNVKAFSFYLLGEGASTTLTDDIIVSQISTPAVEYSGSVPLQDRYLNIWEWNGTDAYTYVGSSTNASHSGPDLVGVWSFENLVLSPESKYIVLISDSPSNTFESTVQLRAAVYAKETQVEEQALWYDSISTNPPGSPSSEEYAVVFTITYTIGHADTNAQLKIKVMTSAQLEQETVSATTFYVNADTKQLLLGEKLLVGKTYNPMVGTDGTSAGVEGLVPAPATTDAGKYLKADGTWSAVDIPANTYTQTNLLAATPISIIDEPVPGGIDDHTLGCWHFENNTTNAVTGSTLTDNFSSINKGYVQSIGKFGDYCAWVQTNSLNLTAASALTTYTVDFWFRPDDGATVMMNPGAHFELQIYSAKAYTRKAGASNWVEMSTSAGGWHHYAFVRNGTNCYCFFDGTLKHTFTVEGSSAVLWNGGAGGTTSHYIDELRVSDNARWIDSFTPQNSAYTVAVPTGNKQITFDGTAYAKKTELAGKQDTISDLATIRSGAAAGATAVQPGALATVATTGAYSDLSGTPTIPTVNNATITFTQGGTTKGSFTVNQASDATIDLDAGGGAESLTPAQAVHAAMPSSSYIDLQIPATDGGTVTAPADGYIVLAALASGTTPILGLRNTVTGLGNTCCSTVGSALFFDVTIPCSQGDVIRVGYSTDVTFNDSTTPGYLRFVYANGNAPEVAPMHPVEVEGFNYTMDGDDLVLTKYTGEDSDIVVPN